MDIYFCTDDKVIIFKKKNNLQKMEVLQVNASEII